MNHLNGSLYVTLILLKGPFDTLAFQVWSLFVAWNISAEEGVLNELTPYRMELSIP
jgi:hypothetical protein